MIVLGIETSCDDSAVALVTADKQILSHQKYTQLSQHNAFGGVVPEVAAREHLKILPHLIEKCFEESQLTYEDLSGIAVTTGPGLIGGLMVGVMIAKALALVHQKPFLSVNHLAGHALVPRLTESLEFPYLLMLATGGHCQLLLVKSPVDFEMIGTTMDDAVGECFDKVAKILGIPMPGGPNLEAMAQNGNPKAIDFPAPMLGRNHGSEAFQFSFSGLKTAVRTYCLKQPNLTENHKADICASFQEAVRKSLISRIKNYMESHAFTAYKPTAFVLSGGVAANLYLRESLRNLTTKYKLQFIAPPIEYCTDNGVMIAWAGIEKLRLGLVDDLSAKPRPRWPLTEK